MYGDKEQETCQDDSPSATNRILRPSIRKQICDELDRTRARVIELERIKDRLTPEIEEYLNDFSISQLRRINR